MMIAAVGPFRPGRPAELGRPDDDRLVEQAALLQVGEQTGDRPVDLGTEADLAGAEIEGQSHAPAAVAAVEDLHEPDAAFDQPPARHCGPKVSSRLVEPVERLRRRCLARELHHLGHGRLHAEGQLVRLDPGAQRRVVGIFDGRQAQSAEQLELPALLLADDVRARRGERQRIWPGRPKAARRRAQGRGSSRRGRPRRRNNRRSACRARRTAADRR